MTFTAFPGHNNLPPAQYMATRSLALARSHPWRVDQ